MKRSIFCLVSACILFGAFALNCGPKNREMVGMAVTESERRVYEVFGMDCPGCHGGLEKLVTKIPNVLQAEANWQKKRLVVFIRPGTQLSDDDIYDAILRANFTPGKRLH